MVEADLVEVDEEVNVVTDVFVLEVVVVVVVDEVDVQVEVVVKNWLIDDPVCFGTYHWLDFGHRS